MKQRNWNKYAILAMMLLVALIGVRVFRTHLVREMARSRTITVEYSFSGGKRARAVFPAGGERRVELALSDGRRMVLRQGISADGARYVSGDESIVFWIKGDTAFLEENGKRTYSDGKAEQKKGHIPF